MFWSTMAMEEREIDIKLNSEDPTLESILSDVHCLQEIRNSNSQLMDLLVHQIVYLIKLKCIISV